MCKLLRFSPLAALLLLGGCMTIPIGPSVTVMPGSGKNFDQFRGDDAQCNQFALGQAGGATANQTAVDSGVTSAIAGATVGALAGAAMGGHSGAAVGAGVGLLAGSAAGTGASQASGYASQRRYDNAYVQCMYASGHRVPMPRSMASGPARQVYPSRPPPPPGYLPPPPPPPGYPPPPPPGMMR